jgi:hypothetical protein
LLVKTCATLAIQAARRSDLEAARYLLENALGAIAAQARRDHPKWEE